MVHVQRSVAVARPQPQDDIGLSKVKTPLAYTTREAGAKTLYKAVKAFEKRENCDEASWFGEMQRCHAADVSRTGDGQFPI